MHFQSRQRGSALVTVLVLSLALCITIASLLRYSLSERRMNYRAAMRLEARNAAEAISEFGLSQVRQLMDSRSDFSPTRFTSNESQIAMPSTSFWAGSNVITAGTTAPEMVVGLVNQVTTAGSGSGLYYFDPADPNNEFEPLKGRWAFRFDIRVLSKATVQSPNNVAGPKQTVYMTQTLSARASPLFSHAIFYNMDLEIWPGPAMNILGGVHTNGNLYVKKQSSSGLALNFVGPVTVAGGGHVPVTDGVPAGLYSGVICPITNTNGTQDNLSSYTDNVYFTTPAGGLAALYGPAPNTSTPNFWRDQKWGQSTESTTTDTSFRNWSSQTFGGNLQTPLHGVQVANPPGITSVASAHKMIEPPLSTSDAGYDADVEAQKYSRQCGLYIVVNPSTTTRTGRLPTGAAVNIPAGKYRAFQKNGTEVVLPGQADYGANNATANTTGNQTGPAIIKIRTNEMYDMRRATFNWAASRSSSNAYTPRVLDCIDVDMTALKLAVDRTINALSSSQVYYTAFPASGTTSGSAAWTGFIYNNLASGTGSSSLPSSTTLTAIHNINLASGSGTMAGTDWNGGIYIESVDATARKDSGVRLINGRGHVASKGSEGLTLATNDALYVLGHFNANGFIDATTTNGNTTNNGRYADDADETPVSIVCDALTILSTPNYTISGTTIKQSMGHNDALSLHRYDDDSTYSTNWATTSPSNSNRIDGISTSVNTVYKLPYDNSSTLACTTTSCKFPGNDTEISAAFLAGIVQSNSGGNGQNSGGANNYPRFNEDFSASGSQKTVCIRGSIVAMYESAVAVEPWNWRTFNAPARLWGFHELFNQGHFPPLTPRVMSYRRVDFNDIDATTYATVKSGWGL